jgi:hypothetical protein
MRPLSFALRGREGQGEGGAIGVPSSKLNPKWVLTGITGTNVHAWTDTTLALSLSLKQGEGTEL